MAISYPLKDEEQMIRLLQKDIDETDKNIKIFAGHLPAVYIEKGTHREVHFDPQRWGEFSSYTFEIGVTLLNYALGIGKSAIMMVLVDDDAELPKEMINGELKTRDKPTWKRRYRGKAYNKVVFPKEYLAILAKHDLDLSHFIKQEREGKEYLLVSEKSLKLEAEGIGYTDPKECSLAYKGFVLNERYFDVSKDYLISFMPGQCKGNICEGVLDLDFNINSSHIFFPHTSEMGGLDETNNGYVKFEPIKPITDMFEEQEIVYRKEELEK